MILEKFLSLVMPIDYEKGDLFQKVILSDCDSIELFCARDNTHVQSQIIFNWN